MALKTIFFKISGGACPLTPLKVLAPSASVGQIHIRPPPPKKFPSSYAYMADRNDKRLKLLS